MKKLLIAGAFFGAFMSFGQQVYPCHTDEMERNFFNSLSPQEQAEYTQQKADYRAEINQLIQANPEWQTNTNSRGNISYTIPIVFHILHEGGPENISDQQVYDAVELMNLDYQKSNSDLEQTVEHFVPIIADVEIEFKLAKKDPNGNCTNGITRTFSSETSSGNGSAQVNAIKAAQGNWPGDKYLNIFVAKDIGGAAGYTQYPSTWMGGSMNNGIFVLYNYCGGTEMASSMTKHTLSHEVGHWLDLPHLWGSSNEPGLQSNCSIDDGVADTPNTIGWTTCNKQGSTCDGTLDNVQNFMEYSYCSTMFTNGQKARMYAALNSSTGGRNKIWKENNLNATGVNSPDVLCKADFIANRTEICVGQEIDFTDFSYSNISGWTWEFEGASPATSTAQNPTITYTQPGTYQVKLSVTDGTNTISETKTNYITVLPNPASLPLIEGFENISSMADSDFWAVENPGNNAKWEVTTNASYTGQKSIMLRNWGQQANNVDAFVSRPLDLSPITSDSKVILSFRYSYRKRSANNSESLSIHISNNCGESFVQRKTYAGNQLGTEISVSEWTPSSQDDWVTQHVTNITSSYWVDNFMVKFQFDSDRGNNIYIDNINIYPGDEEDPLSVIENEMVQGLSVYPNPADDFANIDFTVHQTQNIEISLVDMLGQTVQKDLILAQPGKNKVSMDTQSVRAGVYLIKVKTGNREQVKKIIIQ